MYTKDTNIMPPHRVKEQTTLESLLGFANRASKNTRRATTYATHPPPLLLKQKEPRHYRPTNPRIHTHILFSARWRTSPYLFLSLSLNIEPAVCSDLGRTGAIKCGALGQITVFTALSQSVAFLNFFSTSLAAPEFFRAIDPPSAPRIRVNGSRAREFCFRLSLRRATG